VWRDWALVSALATWSVLEALLREGLAWSPLALLEGVVVALSLLWRRTHPLPAVVAAFSVLTVVDVMRIVAVEDAGRLWSVAAVLVLPYALYGFFLFAAALGTSIRLHANARVRDIEQARLRQRGELARELHDIVGHHVSAIVIQAQAGRVLSATDPERAAAVLQTIEEAASRTWELHRPVTVPSRLHGRHVRRRGQSRLVRQRRACGACCGDEFRRSLG
jgi:signal transduction histidine kinase